MRETLGMLNGREVTGTADYLEVHRESASHRRCELGNGKEAVTFPG